jgi:arginase
MNTFKTCNLLGIPVQDGSGRKGCEMGPAAFRTAGIEEAIASQGLDVNYLGNVTPDKPKPAKHENTSLKMLPEIMEWTHAIQKAAALAGEKSAFPVFMGGDHSLSAGTIPPMVKRAKDAGKPLHVLWLDAHPDFHTLSTTSSGNLHGVPLAYSCGLPGFNGWFPELPATLDPKNVCMMGIRSVDPAEQSHLKSAGASVHDMRQIDEFGIVALLRDFIEKVEADNGSIHVSFDVDFLDPGIAPAVGTTVPGGASFREAHLVMEMLHDSQLVSSLDLVELNPFLDERGRTASLMVDLTASLFGKRVMDRPTQSFAFQRSDNPRR